MIAQMGEMTADQRILTAISSLHTGFQQAQLFFVKIHSHLKTNGDREHRMGVTAVGR